MSTQYCIEYETVDQLQKINVPVLHSLTFSVSQCKDKMKQGFTVKVHTKLDLCDTKMYRSQNSWLCVNLFQLCKHAHFVFEKLVCISHSVDISRITYFPLSPTSYIPLTRIKEFHHFGYKTAGSELLIGLSQNNKQETFTRKNPTITLLQVYSWIL